MAVAKDGAGNQASSAAVSVTVFVPDGAVLPDATGGDGGARSDGGAHRPSSGDCGIAPLHERDLSGAILLCVLWLAVVARRRR
jgi:hypothetical protein